MKFKKMTKCTKSDKIMADKLSAPGVIEHRIFMARPFTED